MKLAALALTLAALASAAAAARSAPGPGSPAPSFRLPSLGGAPVDLARYRGKPVYLTMFASWCGPCNVEAPDIVRLSRRYKSQGLAVIGLDELESRARAAGFAAKYHLPFPVAIDQDGKVGGEYGATAGLPVHVFIDRRGAIKVYHAGEMTTAQIESAIKSVL